MKGYFFIMLFKQRALTYGGNLSQFTLTLVKKVKEIKLEKDVHSRGIRIINVLYQKIDEYHLFVFFVTTGLYGYVPICY